MAGETEVTISASGITDVTIWCTKLDDNLDKPIIQIPIPRQTDGSNGFSGTPTTYLIDIGRLKQVVAIQGTLIDESTDSALDKKDRLYQMVKTKSKVTLTWGSITSKTYAPETISGNINKIGVTETSGAVVDGEQKTGDTREKNYAVQLSVMEGVDKGGGD